MRKWIIPIIIMLMIPIVMALDDCKGIMNPEDVPCSIINAWEFHPCTDYSIDIYNQTPLLVYTINLTDYGVSGRCNITWNISTVGSYVLNWSSGDSSKIIIEVDDKMQIAIAIVFSVFAVLFIGIGIFLYLKFKE